MARKPQAGHELKSLPGQRSISSMFSNSRITASGHGRSVPLMEFLDRKSEKRGSLQGCVVDAGLTLAVRERLNDTRSTKHDERDDGDECSTSYHRRGTPTSKHPRINAQSSSMQDKFFTAHVLDRSRTHVQTAPRPAAEQDWEGHLQKNATQCNFIDLTEDEDPADGLGFDSEVHLHEESSQIYKKRKRSQTEGATMETCPVCNDLFPREMLQAHVESELDALEMLETESVSEAQDSVRVEDGDHGRYPERSGQLKEPGMNSRPRQSLLVLGDEPRYRRRLANVGHKNKRPSSTFNHYADGAGWWDEGGVGVDAEAVGSASVWEGLGSMSFGGML